MPEPLSRRHLFLSSVQAAAALLLPERPSSAEADAFAAPTPVASISVREQWIDLVERVSEPVLAALSRRQLRRRMPVESVPGHEAERAIGSPLEALSRLLSGLAPWLELDPSPGESARETALRTRYRAFAQQAIASAVDPASPDYMRFGQSAQTLVDSSFLALALLRAPRQLIASMNSATRSRLIAALESERKIQPPFNNWLLFAALNEVLLRHLGSTWDRLRIDYAFHELQSWYLGDGTYGDGPEYHADFYNSYVMHPYLLALADGLQQEHGESDEPTWKSIYPAITARAQRYAVIQERTISPRGEFPLLGRSITYRAGAFHLLADIARRGLLPSTLPPAAVRGALTAVAERTLGAPGTFSAEGWLQIGVAGHQPNLAETYISTGSLYLCSAAWLPLGLAPANPFWSNPPADWTQKAVWAGRQAHRDHAMER